jgi:hypothetical protein
MPKTKKKDKMTKKGEGSSKSALDQPSHECREFLIDLIARFYERESTMSLQSSYIRYGEEGMQDALNIPMWHEETLRRISAGTAVFWRIWCITAFGTRRTF